MSGRMHQRQKPAGKLEALMHAIPWRFLLLAPFVLVLVLPVFQYGMRVGQHILPAVTHFFYDLSGPAPLPAPTPLPSFPTALPQAGVVLSTVQAGESCDEILSMQMRMADAGQIFSDANPSTVKALDRLIRQDCHGLQPGMIIRLAPQYPLVAVGGVVLKVDPASPPQLLPTPLINVPTQQQSAIDCSSGCDLTVRIARETHIHLVVQTALPVRTGSWVWAQAMLAREQIAGFAHYPYAGPNASLNGMSLRACDLQVDTIHDANALACDQLLPNTIDDDGGAWMFGVTSPCGLKHWGYPLNLPSCTQVLIWLTHANGHLSFHRGNPVYRFDEKLHVYM